MSKTTFIICEKSFLIRKGLASIIEKIPDTQIIQQIESEDDFKNIVRPEADFVIVNPNLIESEISNSNQKNINLPNNWLGNTQLISLSDNLEIKNNSWIEDININDSQDKILAKLKSLIGHNETKKTNSEEPEVISKREVDILKNIALGLSNKEIADKLFISAHTVVTHRKNITRKLGIKTVPGLTIYAILNKIININETEQV